MIDQKTMPQPLVIIGTGGSAYDVLDIVVAINAASVTWNVVGFLDDARTPGSRHLGYEILGPIHSATQFPSFAFINAIGSDASYRQRPKILASTGLAQERFATLIHPNASVSARVTMGYGVVANASVVIGREAKIGDHVTLCPGCIVGHESTVGDYSILAPGAVISGLVDIESTCYVGARAVIRQRLRIGTGSLIGMGAVVIRDVAVGETVVGNPARSLEPTRSSTVEDHSTDLSRVRVENSPLCEAN